MYYKSCTACGLSSAGTADEATFESGDPLGHKFGAWTSDGDDTHSRVCTAENCPDANKGRVTEAHRYDDDADMICDICGHERTVTPPVPSSYIIQAVAGAGGSISPAGNVSVREGSDQTFTIAPDKGYTVSNVKIDGNSIGAVTSYTFENVSKPHTIEVIFVKDSTPQTGVFVDVAADSYYKDAVDWAVENGITAGTSHTTFSPDAACTRAQAVTFLFRGAIANGLEAVTLQELISGFSDAASLPGYAVSAMNWALANGIVQGNGGALMPNNTCTRGQIVTFLYRASK